MSTTITQLVTAEMLFKMPSDNFRYELVKGELRKMSPAGSEHGVVIINVAAPLAHYVKANNLGLVFGAETGFKIATDPDTVRAPDVAFVRRERIPSTGIPKAFWPGAPDLAVEVISPGDTLYEVDEKVEEWLEAGARLIWIINPRRRTVIVHSSPTETTTLTENDELDGRDVVAGFRLRVSEIFS